MLLFAIGRAQDDTTLVQLGQMVPKFSVTTLDGKTIDMQDCRGKIILLNFFATWCGPCLQELPRIESKIWQNIKTTTCLSQWPNIRRAAGYFRQEKKFTLPIAPDPERKFIVFASIYVPRIFLIDRDGRIVYFSIGYERRNLPNSHS
jgi:peroxiredoxin